MAGARRENACTACIACIDRRLQCHIITTATTNRRCCRIQAAVGCALSRLTLCPAFDLGGAGCIETVDKCNADLDLGCLTVRVACCDAFAEGLEVGQVNATGSREPARSSLLRSGFGRDIQPLVSRPLVPDAVFEDLVAGSRGRASSRHRRPFLRIGMTAVPPRSWIAVWRRPGSQAPSPVTVPICSAGGACSGRWGELGCRPCRSR